MYVSYGSVLGGGVSAGAAGPSLTQGRAVRQIGQAVDVTAVTFADPRFIKGARIAAGSDRIDMSGFYGDPRGSGPDLFQPMSSLALEAALYGQTRDAISAELSAARAALAAAGASLGLTSRDATEAEAAEALLARRDAAGGANSADATPSWLAEALDAYATALTLGEGMADRRQQTRAQDLSEAAEARNADYVDRAVARQVDARLAAEIARIQADHARDLATLTLELVGVEGLEAERLADIRRAGRVAGVLAKREPMIAEFHDRLEREEIVAVVTHRSLWQGDPWLAALPEDQASALFVERRLHVASASVSAEVSAERSVRPQRI